MKKHEKKEHEAKGKKKVSARQKHKGKKKHPLDDAIYAGKGGMSRG